LSATPKYDDNYYYNNKSGHTMKSPKIAAIAQMPESVRKAYDAAANAAWVEAQKLAHANAEEAWRIQIAASKTQIKEITAVSAAQVATILGLRRTLADYELKAEAAGSVAKEEAERASRELAVVTEEATRAKNVAIQVENLRSFLQTAQALFAEIDVGQQGQGAQRDRLEKHAPEDEKAVDPIVAAARVDVERDGRLPRQEADLIAAATVLIKAACRWSSELQAASHSAQVNPVRTLNKKVI
jgi:hypothetical protein